MLHAVARPCTLDPAAMSYPSAAEATDAPAVKPRRCWRRTAVFWLAALVLYWLVLFIGTHLPTQKVSGVAMANDKAIHATAYAVLTTLVCIAWRRIGGSPGLLGRLVIAAGVLTYGAIDEISQPYFGRSCDLMDWIADGAGVTLALVVDAWRHRRGS
jgi:VanZ family protein